mmetsp:Transcript_28219/g.68666  ORF Transcript_28219/g.68666 Transcript_28219/m.68666 type:complete len:1114 (-) Transcript_28219:1954-5295(-)
MFSNSPRRQQQQQQQHASRGGKRGNGMDDSTGTSPTPSGIAGGDGSGSSSSGGGGGGGGASTAQGGTKSSVTAGLYPSSEFPYSSVALSPSRRYAILAGKDVLQIVRLVDVAAGSQNDLATSATKHHNRDITTGIGGAATATTTTTTTKRKDGSSTLEERKQDKKEHAKNQSDADRSRSLDLVRSLKVTQYLVSPASGTGRGDATAGGGVSSSGAVGGTSGGGSRRYGDVRDAFNLMAAVGGGGGIGGDVKNTSAAVAAAAAAGGGSSVGAGAIKVSRVAWSNHFKPISSQEASSSLHNQVAATEEVGGFHMEDTAVDHETTPRNSRHGRNIDTLDPHNAATIDETMDEQSFIAAAGSNGVVAIWDAQSLLFSSAPSASSSSRNVGRRHESSTSGTTPTSGSMMTQPPEGILSQHTRAVNALAWHPRRLGLLLTGSQDSTIKLWERRTAASSTTPQQTTMQESTDDDNESSRRLPWFMKGGRGSSTAPSKADNLQNNNQPKYSEWWCRATFEPKSDAILDVQWSKYQDDTFGVVTGSGNLIVYSMFLTAKALVKIAAHTKEVTTLDWHPINPFLVATGGQDRCVKVWDLESFLNMDKQQGDHTSITINSNTWGTTQSANSTNSSETEKSPPLSGAQQAAAYASGRNTSSGLSGGGGGRAKSSRISKHVLSISASVTQVRWRPASNALLSVVDEMDDDEELLDRHEYHLAVATKESSSAGGSGVISLWSIGRPFMALSVMEGHREGAVSDFVWLQSPILIPEMKSTVSSNSLTACDASYMRSYAMGNISDGLPQQDTILSGSYVWQHCLSVGGDGKCLIQSFVRGERPIRRVPSSCFALTNLSPFQQGFGSLQCFSVYQNVPNQEKDDFSLTALRQDEYTAQATGAFYEPDTTVKIVSREKDGCSGRRVPLNPPKMIFSVVDQGDLDQNGLPALRDQDESLCVAPEVVHVSRFTRLYKMYPDESCPTPIEICSHNGRAAAELDQIALSFMWKTMENLLRGCGLVSGGLPSAQHVHSLPANAMQCAIFPTVKAVLYERADAGDVQTCVVLCEVLEVIEDGGKATKLPGLSIGIVREWYMSYIDILHQMCLFTAATFLIKNCSDPLIGALNQQSTT